MFDILSHQLQFSKHQILVSHSTRLAISLLYFCGDGSKHEKGLCMFSTSYSIGNTERCIFSTHCHVQDNT